jgi:nickel-dependent lactate racemase
MPCVLRYGIDASLSLELPDEALLAHCDAPRGEPLLDVARAVDRALGEPLELPSLSQVALPGDKVVLALDRGVPQAAKIIARSVAALVAAGVSAHEITLLRTLADVDAGAADPLGELPDEIRQAITESIHDPGHRPSLSYLAASADARPIYIHRAIHDADLVISIGCLRLEASLGYYGIGSSIFPTFSDAAQVDHYRSPKAVEAREREKLRKQVDEVSWLLGIQFTIQVVPGAGSEILHVLAGDVQAVFRQGSRLCDEAWSFSVPQRASLVVATILGDATQQTWENVGRALAAASRAVSQEGAVAICTDLSERLGPALQQIVGADDLDETLREFGQHRPADTLPATELVRALQRGKVYLVSRLDEGLVEDLGVSPVAVGQVSRVVRRYDSCIVLANAQYALACPRGECSHPQPAAQPKSWK